MPFLLTVRLAADDGHQTPVRQAQVAAYALKQPVVLKSDGSQIVHQPETALTNDTGHATLTLYRGSEVLTPSDWAVTIDGVTWSGPVPESVGSASSILEMVESHGWGIIAAPKSAPVVAVTGPPGTAGPPGPTGPAIDGLSSDLEHGIDVEGPVNAGTAEPVVLSQPLTDLPHDIFADGAHNDTYIYVPFNSGSFDGIVGAAFLHGNHQHSTSPFTAWVNAAIVADNAGVPDPTTVLQTFGSYSDPYITSDTPAPILMSHVGQTALTFGDTGFDGPFIATIAGQTALTPNTPYWLQLFLTPASDYDGTNPTINLDGHVGSGALGNDDQATFTHALAWTPYVRLIAVTPPTYTASDTAPVPAAHVANPSAGAGYIADVDNGSAFIGHSKRRVAVWGASDLDAGVQGESRHDIGVLGIGHGTAATGGDFQNDDPAGVALASGPGQLELDSGAITSDGAGNLTGVGQTLTGPGGANPTHVAKQATGQTGYIYEAIGSDGLTKFSVGVDGEVLTTDDLLAPSGTVKGKVLEIVPQSTAGAPTTGTHNAGEFYADTAGGLFYCLTGGTPGVWTPVSFNAAANTFTIGPQTFQAGAADHIAAIDQAAAGQTANIREVRDSTGQVLVKVDAHGNIVAVALTPPAAPTLGVKAGGDITGTTYQWACTLVNAQGETTLGTLTALADLTAQRQSLTMPATCPDGCTFNLYRNQSGGSVWQQVTTGLAAGAVYVDDVSDGVLGSAAPTANATAPHVGIVYRGLTGDGQTPAGVVVAGGVAAGDPVGGSLFNYFGTQTIQDATDPGAPLLDIEQTAPAGRTIENRSAVRIVRGSQATAHTLAPILYIENDDASSVAAAISYVGPSGGQGFQVGLQGGIGCFGHAAQTAPRTLAQSVITAITDANAKTAVQAIANALSDMGALTLT